MEETLNELLNYPEYLLPFMSHLMASKEEVSKTEHDERKIEEVKTVLARARSSMDLAETTIQFHALLATIDPVKKPIIQKTKESSESKATRTSNHVYRACMRVFLNFVRDCYTTYLDLERVKKKKRIRSFIWICRDSVPSNP